MDWLKKINGAESIVYLAFLASIGVVSYNFYNRGNARINELELKSQIEPLIDKAILKSSGEDRIWSAEEKRTFLDNFEISSAIGEGQDIYFRINPIKIEEYGDKLVEIIAGYNIENNGELFFGSTAKSGTLLGRISQGQLEDYISTK